MSSNKYAERFIELKPKYEKLGMNVKQALETLLDENNIPFLSINYRVKGQNSFLEKIERKKYEKPFTQTEDICGIRIICYFQNDIEKIQEIINAEFEIFENQSKQELLNATEFGYRSTHLIAQVKNEWTSTPAYRGIDNLKFEIQIRTILMHSWAEIEHKLAYKSESDIPKDLRRKFSHISAILENADIQFEEIKNRIHQNKGELLAKAEVNKKFDESTELNLDNLQAFLDYAFKVRDKNIDKTREVLNEMLSYNITFPQLINGHIKYKKDIIEIEKEFLKNLPIGVKKILFDDPSSLPNLYWEQSGAARLLMALINIEYRLKSESQFDQEFIDKYAKNINKPNR